MDKNGKVTSGPYWTQNWIEAMWRFTAERFVNFDSGAVDFEALGREEYEFRKALFFRNFKNSPRAKMVFDEANEEYKKKVENGSKGGRPRKDTTADGDTREDSQDRKSGTSANLYGEAPHREAGDESTTVSRNIGNDTEARQSMRTGEDSVRRVGVASPAVCHKSAGAPVRNSGRRFRNKEEYMQWAIDSGLDATDASECWDATLERGGKDKDGNVVKNIKAFANRWCRTRAENRRTA